MLSAMKWKEIQWQDLMKDLFFNEKCFYLCLYHLGFSGRHQTDEII